MDMNKDELQSVINTGIKSAIGDLIKELLKKVNIYTALQIFWLVEVYYLMINSLISFALAKINEYKTIIGKSYFPSEVIKYNNLVLGYAKKWNEFIILFGIALFIAGGIISIMQVIPQISDYNIIRKHCNYGVYAGEWLIIIFITYKIFEFNSILFLLTLPIIYGLIKGSQKLKNWLGDNLF